MMSAPVVLVVHILTQSVASQFARRTAKEYNQQTKQWERIPPTWYEGCERPSPPSPPPTSVMLPQRNRDKQALSPKARNKIRLAHRSATQHVKSIQLPAHSAGQEKSLDAALAFLYQTRSQKQARKLAPSRACLQAQQQRPNM